MNPVLALAAFFALFTASAHFFFGSPRITRAVQASDLDARIKLVLNAVWHMASVALFLSVPAFFFGSLPGHAHDTRPLVLFLSLLWCAFGAVFLVTIFTQADRSKLFKLPQWILLLPVGLLGFWGSFASPI